MKIYKGTRVSKISQKTKKAIIHFEFENYILFVFAGELSEFDILIKYKKCNLRIRTPKHIHWAVDMLIKLQCDTPLTKNFLIEIKKIWESCSPLVNNNYETLKNLVETKASLMQLKKYETLNQYGEYPVDFLFVLMLLLSTQEKTNRPDAYMFGSIINELMETDYDIFKIVSTAGFSGRK